MARMPGAVWQGEHGSMVMQRYDVVCIHTIVGYAPAHAAHFSVKADGTILQSRDTRFRSGANLEGNHRVIAIENEDHGPAFGQWNTSDGHAVPALTAAQVVANARILRWAHDTHGVPLQLCPDSRPTSRGLAYHRQGIDGNFATYQYPGRVAGGETWTKWDGKVCFPTDSTDVLTSRGWVPVGKVDDVDLVASVAPDGTTSFDRAARVAPFVAEVVSVSPFESTADHEWVVRRPGPSRCLECDFVGKRRSVGVHRQHTGHRVERSDVWVKVPASQVSQRDVLLSAAPRPVGLPLSLDEVRIAAWLFADGHFMHEGGDPYGVEWHFAKQRKQDRVTTLLDALGVAYRVTTQTDGTHKVRVWGDQGRKLIRILPTKRFGDEWLGMSGDQVDALWAELVQADGASTVADHKQVCFSVDKESLEVIQGASVLNGRAATLWFSGGLWWLQLRKHNIRLAAARPSRVTEVACVTTKYETVIIRQAGRVAVSGNCPGDRRISQREEILRLAIGGAVTPPPDEEDDDMKPHKIKVAGTNYYAYVLPDGTVVDRDYKDTPIDGSEIKNFEAVYETPQANAAQVDQVQSAVKRARNA